MVWDIYDPSMEMIWDNLWSMYVSHMGLTWAIAFHIKPIQAHCLCSIVIVLTIAMEQLRIS